MSKIPAGKPRELAPEGAHQACLCQIIDMGTQPSNDPKYKPTRRVQLGFELTDEKTEEGNKFVQYKTYTFSKHKKSNLAADLKSWLGLKDSQLEDFEMDNALSKNALITIAHKTTDNGEYANITNVSALPKSMKVKKGTEPLVSLYLDENFDKAVFDKLPEFLRTKIAASPEYAAIAGATMKEQKGNAKEKPAKQPAAKTPAKKTAGKKK